MRLMQRVRRIESAAGIVPIRGEMRVAQDEAEAAFVRLREALRVGFLALIGDQDSSVDEVQLGKDVETLKLWCRQRGFHGDAEFSRAEDAALESMTDEQLRAVIVRLEEPQTAGPAASAAPAKETL